MASNNKTNGMSPAENRQPPGVPKKGESVVHVRADSDSTLDDLFQVVTKGNQSIPFRMRKLPPSFFKPPPSGSKSPMHSRENSVDGGGQQLQQPMSPMQQQPVGLPQQPQQPQQSSPVFHMRTSSAPATMQENLSRQQQQQQAGMLQHLRQLSFDPVGGAAEPDLGPLPPGWEAAKTPQGQMYFMNHNTKTTQWEDPRKQLREQLQQQQVQQQAQQQQLQPQVNGGPPAPPVVRAPPQMPQQQLLHPQQPLINPHLGPLPLNWEQDVTPDGEVYYINHETRMTTWFDPRLSESNQQQVPQRVQRNDLGSPAGAVGLDGSPVVGPTEEHRRQQQMRLQRLENERKLLQQRREELMKEELLRKQMQVTMNQAQEMMMRQSLGENSQNKTSDPFLSGGNTVTTVTLTQAQQQQQQQVNLHNRQESADSGVGMGSQLHLVSIPEDIPVDMEVGGNDLDTTLTNENANKPNVVPAQQGSSMDMSKGPGEELMSSLPEEIRVEFSANNLMVARAAPQSEGLTWL